MREDGISIALATYNGGAFIDEQLESYAAQTLLPMELVVTDDGSTDDTCERVERFAGRAPFPVRLFRNPERLNFRDNFMRAASLCEGRYIAYSDQDDCWLPTKLETGLRRLRQDGSALAIHTAHIGDERLAVIGRLGQSIPGDGVLEPLSALPLPGGSYGFTLLFERSLLSIVDPGFRPEQPQEPGLVVYHDLWAFLLATVFGRISHIAEPLAIYRQHAQMTSSGPLRPFKGGRVAPLWHYEFRRKFAEDCANAFDAALPSIGDEGRQGQAAAAVAWFRTLERANAARLALYRHRNPLVKAGAYSAMVLRGIYRSPASGGLGRSAMAKDLVLGALSLGRPLERE